MAESASNSAAGRDGGSGAKAAGGDDEMCRSRKCVFMWPHKNDSLWGGWKVTEVVAHFDNRGHKHSLTLFSLTTNDDATPLGTLRWANVTKITAPISLKDKDGSVAARDAVLKFEKARNNVHDHYTGIAITFRYEYGGNTLFLSLSLSIFFFF